MKKEQQTVVLGQPITMEQFIAVCRFGAQVEFSDDYCQRVRKSRQLVERWVDEGKVMYGVTTGFGSLCTKAISKEETAKLQENIILSHSVSLGEPLSIERVRGVMLMILQNLGQGYSGVRLELLELSRSALQQYATKFKGDGISQADMMQMYDQVERTVTGISATADTTEHKKEATVSLLADTKKAIETAYATKGGEQA